MPKYKITIMRDIAQDVMVNAKDELEAENIALENSNFKREDVRIIAEYCKTIEEIKNENTESKKSVK